MIITQTPLRVSFLGGGTDYPEYFRQHGGATLGTAIDKYTYVIVNPLTEFFDYRLRVSYSKTELCREIDEIKHPAVREALRFMGISHGVEISVVSDLPARTGLGSSSSFTVGLLHALHAFKGEVVSSPQLAAEAIHVERELIGERVGLQDQYTCACGGLLHLSFQGNDEIHASLVVVPPPRRKTLQENLLLFYTGLQRSAHEVLQQQMERTQTGVNDADLGRLCELVEHGLAILGSARPLAHFGQLLHEAWGIKRNLSQAVSNEFIDGAYERARLAGAIGGKLLGAGGGGFLLLYVEPAEHRAVRQALSDMREVIFQFETRGSRLIHYQPQ